MPRRKAVAKDREDLLRYLRLCYWKILTGLDDRLGRSGLTARQGLFLKTLEETGPCNSRTLCEALHVTPADVTGLADRMERKGYIMRSRAPMDRRQIVLEMTPAGLKALDKARGFRDKMIDGLLDDLTDEERRSTLAGLTKLLEALTEQEARADGFARRPRARGR